MKLIIEISLDNAAMQNEDGKPHAPAVGEVLRSTANRIEDSGEVELEGIVRDYNGNTIGPWKITGE